ncbi:MAG TPA: nucleotidyltransferase family protein [Elusimicrobiota bacterium]|nr:nucleotidyltransferase family protein [Elusimicrobiota bacterium]
MTDLTGARVLLLAAGRGKRSGGPKAWRPYEGTTLLEAQLAFFRGLVGEKNVSVAIQDAWRERCESLSREAVWVASDPDASPLASLQNLVAGSPEARSFVLHVDMPVFLRGVYEDLWKVGADAVAPVFEGRRGHPVLLSPRSLAEISRLDPATDRLDHWLRGRRVAEAPVSTGVIHLNLNEPGA